MVLSTPSHPTVEALLCAASSHLALQGGQEAQGDGSGPAAGSAPLYTFTSHSVEAPSTGGGSSGQLAASLHVGAAKRLLQKYQAVVGASKWLPPIKHAVEHLIDTTAARPVASRYRCLDPERLATAKVEFATMESQGIIQHSKSS